MKKTVKSIIASLLALTVALCVVACGEKTPTVSVAIEKTPTQIVLKEGEKETLTANVEGTDNKMVVWSSDNVALVTVSQEGEIYAIASPAVDTDVVITATAVADTTKTDTITVKVLKAEKSVSIRLDSAPAGIKFGDKITLVATVDGAEDKTVIWSSSNDSILSVNEKGEVMVVAAPLLQEKVTIIATAAADVTKKAEHTFTVKNKIEQGTVGELTSEMIAAIGNPSITVTGTVTDYYNDYKTPSNNKSTEYTVSVKMEDGRWQAKHHVTGKPLNAVSDIYLRGEENITNANGVSGHALQTVYINEKNEVTVKTVKDNKSIPAVWEDQHLYNHLDQLQISKFKYDENVGAYKYELVAIDRTGSNYYQDNGSGLVDMTKPAAIDTYLMLYLTYSLTPFLEADDAFVSLYVFVEDGQIVKMQAESQKVYSYDANSRPIEMAYTAVELFFTDVGTTKVENPAPYAGPDAMYAEPLKKALEEMKTAKSYTYSLKDVTTRAPQADDSDYMSQSNAVMPMSTTVHNGTYETGTVGSVAYVTEDAVLFRETTKYSYTSDGRAYRVMWSGYRQIQGADSEKPYYEKFEYSNNADGNNLAAMKGTKRIYGILKDDIMPTFDFSANVFQFDHTERDKETGKIKITYYLLATKASREVAMAMSSYRYAASATVDNNVLLTITVSEDGKLISTEFPYDINYGSYLGYCTTTYSDINNTVLPEGVFNDYVERTLRVNWNQYTLTDYYYEHTTQWTTAQATANAETVLRAIYKESYVDVPTPDKLMNVFGDEINGPFFNWTSYEENGEKKYHDYMSITTSSSNYDENVKITDYDEIIAALDRELIEGCGFAKSMANCGTSAGNSYVTYVKGDVMIVVENNGTKYFWIYFRQAGTWSLDK